MIAVRYSRNSRRALLALARKAAFRQCDGCGRWFNPLQVPCAAVYCARCWSSIARAFELPTGTVACQLGSACPSFVPRPAHANLQRALAQEARAVA